MGERTSAINHCDTPELPSKIQMLSNALCPQSVPRILKMCELCLQDSETMARVGVRAGLTPRELLFLVYFTNWVFIMGFSLMKMFTPRNSCEWLHESRAEPCDQWIRNCLLQSKKNWSTWLFYWANILIKSLMVGGINLGWLIGCIFFYLPLLGGLRLPDSSLIHTRDGS